MREIALIVGNPSDHYALPVLVPQQIQSVINLPFQNIVSFLILLILFAIILLAFFFILFGGIKWITSQGDKKQLEGAQKTIQYALVGLVLGLLSFFIINFLGFLFGVPLLGK